MREGMTIVQKEAKERTNTAKGINGKWKEGHVFIEDVTNNRIAICDDACLLIMLVGSTELPFFILLKMGVGVGR